MNVFVSIAKRRRDIFYLILSFLMVLVIFINSMIIGSPVIGAFASIVYFLVNGNLLGNAFFKEERELKLPLGALLLIALLGLTGWLFIIFYRLRISEVTITLCVIAAFSFLINKAKEIASLFKHAMETAVDITKAVIAALKQMRASK